MIPIGILLANKNTGTVNVIFPILLLLIVAAGEIHVNATSYALVGDLIKPVHQGIFTGYMFVNVTIGIVISGPVSNYAIGNKLKAEDITAFRHKSNVLKYLCLPNGYCYYFNYYFLLNFEKINKVFDNIKE